MRKIIAIGESVLDTVFHNGQPVKAMVGGRIANAVASLGALNHPCFMVSECCTDRVGDIIVDFFTAHNVDVNSIDRYTEGESALSAIFEDGKRKRIINYGRYPGDRFDVVWPRIDKDDVIIFGSLYAIDLPQRERLFELVTYAKQRSAIIIYLPGFQHGINFRITRVMPNIHENLEIADLVIATEHDLHDIFPGESDAEAWKNHIAYDNNSYAHINTDLTTSLHTQHLHHTYPAGTTAPVSNMLGWQAGYVAGLVDELFKRNITTAGLQELDETQWGDLLAAATTMAATCAASPTNTIG